MGGLWPRRDVRTAVYAAIFAVWCVGWVFGALEITRSLPGLMSLKGSKGAYELLPWFIGQPPWIVAVAFAVAAFLLAWLLLKLLYWLDREGEARAALRWALSSTSLNLLILLLPLVLIVMALAMTPSMEEWIMTLVVAAVVLPLIVLTPFVAFNPVTLLPPQLQYWWRLKWPGWRPVVVALLLIAVLPELTGFASDAFVDGRPWSVWVGIQSLEIVIDSLAEIAAVVIWLSRGHRDEVLAGLARLANMRFLRAYLGYFLMIGLLVLPFAVPILVQSVYFIYVAPQYDGWAQQMGNQLPWSMQVFSKWKQLHALWAWLPLGLPITALAWFCLGRLLVRYGAVERRPEHLTVDEAEC